MQKQFRARLRFRVSKCLNSNESEIRFDVSGKNVVLSSPSPEIPLKQSNWLIMNSREFDSEESALRFAASLKLACEVASVTTRLGIDCGIDRETASLSSAVTKRIEEVDGALIRGNVHGIDVFEDNPQVLIFSMSATGTVSDNPDRFLGPLTNYMISPDSVSRQTRDVLLLLNYALMRPEPVAQVVFSFSAVEMLGQNEGWSSAQRALIDHLKSKALDAEIGSEDERTEVADAISRSLHKVSLRQGVLRLLRSLGLECLKPEWDRLYGLRSSLVHGLAPEPGVDYVQFASEVVSLCGRILLTVISKEIPGVDQRLDETYPLRGQ